MNTDEIVAQIDTEIRNLQQARAILSSIGTKEATSITKVALSSTVKLKKRKMSASGKARIAAAQKARWAKVKKAAKKAVTVRDSK